MPRKLIFVYRKPKKKNDPVFTLKTPREDKRVIRKNIEAKVDNYESELYETNQS